MSIDPDEPSPNRHDPDCWDDPDGPVDPSPADASRLLWSGEVVAWSLSISRRTLQRQVSQGLFPKADRYINEMPRWKPQTVRDWVDRPV